MQDLDLVMRIQSSRILATGLLFFLLFMPLFSLIGDLALECRIENTSGCEEYNLMQGVISAGLLFGLLLSVGGAYQMRKPSSRTVTGVYSLVEQHNLKTDDDYLLVAKELDKIKDQHESNIRELLSIMENQDNASPTLIEELRDKQNELIHKIDDIEEAKKEMRKQIDTYNDKIVTNQGLEIKDSAVAGDINIHKEPDYEKIAKMAVQAYKSGLEDK